eukprot:1265844-Pyramimonas_sp.AAC.1
MHPIMPQAKAMLLEEKGKYGQLLVFTDPDVAGRQVLPLNPLKSAPSNALKPPQIPSKSPQIRHIPFKLPQIRRKPLKSAPSHLPPRTPSNAPKSSQIPSNPPNRDNET